MRRGRALAGLLLVAVLAVPFGAPYYVRALIEKRMQFRIEGRTRPVILQSAFEIESAHFVWADRIEFLSGNIHVDYDLLRGIAGLPTSVRLWGSQAKVRLLGDWAEIQGAGEAAIRKFSAHLVIGPEGIQEIRQLEVDSPEFQFHLKPMEAI